jgi:hypothetical protein
LAAAFAVVPPVVGQEGGQEPEPSQAQDDPSAPPAHRVFASSRADIDELLSRPYGPEIPLGTVGDRLWASSPQGWAFRDDVHWVFLTNIRALELDIRDEHGMLQPSEATYYPSHVHLEGAERSALASASHTHRGDSVQAPLSKPFAPEKRWTCWSSGRREDWYAVDFGAERTLTGLKVWFFDDSGKGGCRPPTGFEVQRWQDGKWQAIDVAGRKPEEPAPGENAVTFAAPVKSERIRLVFHHAGPDFYTGLYGLEPAGSDPAGAPGSPLKITADKFITPDDILVSVVRIRNPTDKPATVRVMPVLGWEGQQEYRLVSNRATDKPGDYGVWAMEGAWQTRYHDFDVRHLFRFNVTSDPPVEQEIRETLKATLADSSGPEENAEWMRASLPFSHVLAPGETKVFKAALEIKRLEEPTTLDRVLAPPPVFTRSRIRLTTALPTISPERQDANDPLEDQVAGYARWFDENLAYFDCSDESVRKMYYHRAYTLRKNMLDPRLGALKWPTQAEGRWRSTWYPNVISYGAAHQVREARWLRDPRYWRGHLQTWAENQKPDHVYPSHVKPEGPQSGQYTDWITASAWDGHLVHPSKEFLAPLADKLADNVRGWQAAYDPDGDGLLLVDSHWWTGMEYQPSFFAFSDYKTAPDFLEPAEKVSLERVDLTAYNFGNAVAVAKIYRLLGQAEKAKEFDDLAAKIAKAVQEKMWKPAGKFFYSLRATDDAVADVKEVVGVYPFYFGLPPAGKGFEAAWESILDREQFWSSWPVASVSKQCPAYSQTGWPQADGRSATCMWNGPTWPHANSIVLTAMARTIRSDRELTGRARESASPLTTEKLWELFSSFTKAQYRGQDLEYPWTGEYYNGDTAEWKTRERDYNHSTWLDVLIPEIIGLVPREDDILEVDPLMPKGALSHFLLDGQSYHGRDVTIAWDAPDEDDKYDDGREGFDVYVDGKLAASAKELSRLRVDLKTGKPVAAAR